MLTTGKRVILISKEEQEQDYVFLGVERLQSGFESACFYPYSKDMLSKAIIKKDLYITTFKYIHVKKELKEIKGIKEWYLKNRLLFDLPFIDSDVLPDKELDELNPDVGCQYLGHDGIYKVYLGYNWFLNVKQSVPITVEKLEKLDSFDFKCFTNVTREKVKGFKIKLKDYPFMENNLKRVKRNRKTAMRWLNSR